MNREKYLIGITKKAIYTFLLLQLILVVKVSAQDAQFSQFYAQPLNLNPALTGANRQARAIANYRNQWPNADARYISYAVSYDQYIPSIRSGLGLYVLQDQSSALAKYPFPITIDGFNSQEFSGLQRTVVSLNYSYMVPLGDNWALQFGLAPSANFWLQGANDYILPSQIDDNGNFTGGFSSATYNSINFDLGGGALVYSRNFWAGFSSYHIIPNVNNPFGANISQSYSVHSGYKIPIGNPIHRKGRKNRSNNFITPVINYFQQDYSAQVSVGTYATLSPIFAGIWYRNLLQFNVAGATESNLSPAPPSAITMMAGIQFNGFTINYSYDYYLGEIANGGGAHEISITKNFPVKSNEKKSRSKAPALSCPNPFKTGEKIEFNLGGNRQGGKNKAIVEHY